MFSTLIFESHGRLFSPFVCNRGLLCFRNGYFLFQTVFFWQVEAYFGLVLGLSILHSKTRILLL